MSCSIHVFGSANGIGKWLITNIFSKHHKVFAYDIDEKVGIFDNNTSIKACHLDITQDSYLDMYKNNFTKNDFFVLAVPEKALNNLIQEFSKYSPDGLFICATSVQEQALDLISRALPNSDVLGFHPLFGHLVENPYGQLVALCNYDEKNNNHTYFKSIIKNEGLLISTLTAKEHDKAMSYVQALTHFQYLALFKLFEENNISINTLLKVKTPPFENLCAFASRMFTGNSLTYASIQNSSNAFQVRKEFIDVCNKLNDSFRMNDINHITNEIEYIKKKYPKHILNELSNHSVQSITAVQEKEKLYHKLKIKRQYFLFKTNTNSRVKIGKLIQINNKTLVLNICTTSVKTKDKELYPFPFNCSSYKNYEKDGIHIKEKINVEIKKSNFILLEQSSVNKWMKNNLYYITRRITINIDKNIDDKLIEKLTPKLVKGLIECSFVQLSKIKGNSISIVLDIKIHPSYELNKIKSDLIESLLNLSSL